MIQRIKGTQDHLDLSLWNFLLAHTSNHLQKYNFSEIRTPILEPVELFKRSLGLETDVVSKEMYLIQGDESLCLRPEATASFMRAFMNESVQQTPWKVFTWGPMFRHERPQKGRFREFHQINIEVVGSHAIEQDIQLIAMLDRLFQETLKLDTYALQLNFLGCQDDRSAYKKILYDFLSSHESSLCSTCLIRKERNIMRVFDCKAPSCQALYEKAPFLTEYLCGSCSQEWQTVKHSLEMMSVSFSHRPTLVRGLDYYDKTVFEFVSMDLGAQNTFCGGGRYNSLATELGGPQNYPSVGASIGIERLLLLLENHRERLQLPEKPPLYVIMPLSAEQKILSLLLADELLARNLCTEVLLEGDSVKSMMRKANKLGARYALLIGPDEQAQKMVTVKQMMTGQEEKILQKDLVSYLDSADLLKK